VRSIAGRAEFPLLAWAAVDRSLAAGADWCLPAHGTACFDMLPATIVHAMTGTGGDRPLDLGRLTGRYERVLLVYFDAFGWQSFERHAGHPLLEHARARGHVSKLTSQFPSTTAAHMTTIHTGLPVGEHGVYEWFFYLPKADRIIAPLLFSFAGDPLPNTLLAHGLSAGDVFPDGDFYPTLRDAGIAAHVALPVALAASTPGGMLLRHTDLHPFSDIAGGVAVLGEALAAADRGYGFVYLPDVDTAMHKLGPEHPDVERLIDDTLTTLDQSLLRGSLPGGTLVLITADHGMAGIDPERTFFVNELWPEIVDHLERGADGRPLAPAGSSRDLFLHTRPESHGHVRATLQALLGGSAEVHSVADLIEQGVFGPKIGGRLRERVGDLVVLPHPGEAVYWNEPPRFTQPYRGQHGGLAHAEMEIPLIAFVT
jgi:Type I phosphodiesterase / nucleotide pyrophosphatase